MGPILSGYGAMTVVNALLWNARQPPAHPHNFQSFITLSIDSATKRPMT